MTILKLHIIKIAGITEIRNFEPAISNSQGCGLLIAGCIVKTAVLLVAGFGGFYKNRNIAGCQLHVFAKTNLYDRNPQYQLFQGLIHKNKANRLTNILGVIKKLVN